jgi:hypothetical protein
VVGADEEVGEVFFKLQGSGEVFGQFRQEAPGLRQDRVAGAVAIDWGTKTLFIDVRGGADGLNAASIEEDPPTPPE